ncbi:MAG TPA: 2-oxo acid dehydrogenase subunit E2, partial [Planctomycetota bacterium]|nr:2-oxo acid dehydrogenase subunit E2 [Planctomycetota bacterium]HQB00605.1 2-oxo acid dehydrogenase subunit E2 [Planctomycetota bacterium]
MKRPNSFKVKKVHRYRRLMPYIMPTRNESVVYYDTYVEAEKLLQFLEKHQSDSRHITLTHLVVYACKQALYEHPNLNQYVAGYTLYQRTKVEISFSIKKEKVSKSPLKIIKLLIEKEHTLPDLIHKIQEKIGVERSDKKTYLDREIHLATILPRCLLRFACFILRILDYWNLLPHAFIEKDPMYASLFIANLGSLGLDPGYHHLYEYGACSIFLMMGAIKKMPVVENDQVIVKNMLHFRWSYDERIDDGLSAVTGIKRVVEILENPDKYFSLTSSPTQQQDITEKNTEQNAEQNAEQ